MSNKKLNLIISKIDGPVLNEEVVSVTVPGVDGVMTLLANHEALISPLKEGVIKVKIEDEGDEEIFEIESGTLEVSNNSATILI